ncbi:MAG: tetratricopeptide repeat protein [Methylocapsa sp.]|nr:tetratricopeptide repeat protein [Methylocapsa sp.]
MDAAAAEKSGPVRESAPDGEDREAALAGAELLAGALEFFRAGRLDEAQEAYRQVLAREPNHPLCLHHLGLIAHQRGEHAAAEALIESALSAKPDYAEAMSNLAVVRRTLGDKHGSLAAAKQAVMFAPALAQAHSNLGNALEDLGWLDAALAAYRKAAALSPAFVEAHLNCAHILRRLGRTGEAAAACEGIISIRPDAAEPHFNLGNILKELRQPGKAADAFRRALALRPNFAEAHVNLGNLLQAQEDHAAAVEAYIQALALRPDLAEAHANLGAAYENRGELSKAIDCYRTSVKLNPDFLAVRAWLYHQRRQICDWDGIEAEEAEILSLLAQERNEAAHPFVTLSMGASALLQRQVAQKFVKKFEAPPFVHERPEHNAARKLRIGYLSSDFCRHATALLMAELFERHDKSSYEIFAYSHGPDDRSELGRRLRDAFDIFTDISPMTDEEAARRVKEDRIDILVELKGFTKGARTGIAAQRPAPVQVSFVGFPGTMGADFIDYVIADPIVLPVDQQAFYNEKIVHLPHCYQPNDTKRLIADLTPTRAQCGLPEQGFVFCSFNNTYKITPKFFTIWMRLLKETPGSVLWLLDANGFVKDNLRREAALRGVDPERLIFAPRLAPPEHLARHRLAGLFLDTLPYNAHTTASDALWAGLPVLTCMGETFAGRVAASLLQAAGLPELVTRSAAEYEALALHLAREPEVLQALRHKLAGNRLSAPVFDILNYTRAYEAALRRMWEIWANGSEPQSFTIAPGSQRALAETAKPPIARIAYRACPLCDGSDFPAVIAADCSKHPIYHPRLPPVMNWLECRNCGHVFTEGYFDGEALALVFAKTQPCQTVGYDMERQRPVSARIVERIARHMPEGYWLDAGFGNGSLLFTAQEWGYTPIGLDLRAENVRALKLLGIEAHCQPIEALDHDSRYSIISMADVLEHIPFPKMALAAAHGLLREGGVLFLSMPNMDSMIWQLLHANGINPYWAEIEHYHNFSRGRLYDLLAQHGFRPAEYNVSKRYRACMEVIAIKGP